MRKISLFLAIVLIIGGILSVDTKIKAEEDVYVDIKSSIPCHIVIKGTSFNITTTATLNNKKLTNFIYTSENKKVATVDKMGKITTIGYGDGRIKVTSKEYPENSTWVNFIVKDRIIKISGAKSFEAGKIYQLKASEKNVMWECNNLEGENANASIDAETGKLKIRNAGTIYVKCISKDGKALGSVYIKAKGPKIKKQDITLKKITIDQDENIINATELVATGKLPETVSVPFTYNNTKGKVDLIINWMTYSSKEYNEKGIYTMEGKLKAPEGYFLDEYFSKIRIDIDFKVGQTDARKKVVSINKLKTLHITDDLHLMDYWDIVVAFNDVLQLQCSLEDGSTVVLPASAVSYKAYAPFKVGSYQCEIRPKSIPGYNIGDYDGPSVTLNIKIKKKQTPPKVTIDNIAPESWVIEFVSQETM